MRDQADIVPQNFRGAGETQLFTKKCLASKIALVTGASSGLGAHFARVLAGAGAEVILAARREDALERVTEEIAATGGHASALRLDVTDAASIAAAPLEHVDILVNNAGMVIEGRGAGA